MPLPVDLTGHLWTSLATCAPDTSNRPGGALLLRFDGDAKVTAGAFAGETPRVTGVALDEGDIVVVGSYYDHLCWGEKLLSTAGDRDGFVAAIAF